MHCLSLFCLKFQFSIGSIKFWSGWSQKHANLMVIMYFESNSSFAREVPYSVQSEYIITACSTTVKVLIDLSFSMVTRMSWSQKLLTWSVPWNMRRIQHQELRTHYKYVASVLNYSQYPRQECNALLYAGRSHKYESHRLYLQKLQMKLILVIKSCWLQSYSFTVLTVFLLSCS